MSPRFPGKKAKRLKELVEEDSDSSNYLGCSVGSTMNGIPVVATLGVEDNKDYDDTKYCNVILTRTE
jgi:hypothetical protein